MSNVRERLIRWRDHGEIVAPDGTLLSYALHPQSKEAQRQLLTEAIEALTDMLGHSIVVPTAELKTLDMRPTRAAIVVQAAISMCAATHNRLFTEEAIDAAEQIAGALVARGYGVPDE